MAAENQCLNEPVGGGYGSCLAIELGYVRFFFKIPKIILSFDIFQLSPDCRTQHPDVIMDSLVGHEEYYDGCLVEPFPPSLNATDGWHWPGSYPYETTDASFTNFLHCLKVLFIGDCQQKALETFQC